MIIFREAQWSRTAAGRSHRGHLAQLSHWPGDPAVPDRLRSQL